MFTMFRSARRLRIVLAWAGLLSLGLPQAALADSVEPPAFQTTAAPTTPVAGPLCDDAMDEQAESEDVATFCLHRRKGLAAYDAERYRDAITSLTQAYRIYPAPRILYKVGQAHRRLGELREARQFLSMFLSVDPSIPPEQRMKVEAIVAELSRRIASTPVPRPKWRLAMGGGLISVGGLLLGFGAPALAVDGGCVQPPDLPGALCPQRFETTALGTALVVPAVALVVIGTGMAAWPSAGHPSAPQKPTQHAAGATKE